MKTTLSPTKAELKEDRYEDQGFYVMISPRHGYGFLTLRKGPLDLISKEDKTKFDKQRIASAVTKRERKFARKLLNTQRSLAYAS